MSKQERLAEYERALKDYLALVPGMHLHREKAQAAWHRLRWVRQALGSEAPVLEVSVWGM